MTETFTVIVNGEERAASAKTLADLLIELGMEGDWLATAMDGELVAAEARQACSLHQGARIEILSPMQGG